MITKRHMAWMLIGNLMVGHLAMAQITDPIPEPIQTSHIVVAFEIIAHIPNSGPGNALPPRFNMLTHAGDGSGRLFVNDTEGPLYVLIDGRATVYMDVKALVGGGFFSHSQQTGFTYFAFHPEFVQNGIFYTVTSELTMTGTPDFPVTQPITNVRGEVVESAHHSVVREWTTAAPTANTFSGTGREILRVEQPYTDHNMGQLAFNPNAVLGDPDYGLLYIPLGDGGSHGFPVRDSDPLDNGQNLSTPLGTILRLDPLGNNGINGQYGIPADNPFANDDNPGTLNEIWAYGLRNPHRISWDTGGTGKMLIADIGQAFVEEINLGLAGANYGWGEREGTWVVDEFDEDVLFDLPEDDASFGFTYPVAQYDHEIREREVAIAGGFVYRGSAIAELVGHYVFADFAADGRFFHVPESELIEGQQATLRELRLLHGNREASFLEIINDVRSDVRFGVDEAGALYVTTKRDGLIRKIVPTPKFLEHTPPRGRNSSPPFLKFRFLRK